jgi:uncharacterized membrane protein
VPASDCNKRSAAVQIPLHTWGILGLGLFAGFVGSVIDSLIGCTLQYSGFDSEKLKVVSKPGENVHKICGNDVLTNSQTNLVANSITAVLTAALAVFFFCR